MTRGRGRCAGWVRGKGKGRPGPGVVCTRALYPEERLEN